MINKHKSNKIKENSNTVRLLNNGTDHRHSKSCCDQSSPARRTMIAAHLSGITNVKKFFIVIINSMHNLGQYNLVRLIVMYAFMRNCSFPIYLHMHPKSFDAGLTEISSWISSYIHYKVWDEIFYPFPNFNSAAVSLFGNGLVISSHTLLGMWLLIHAGIEVNLC